MITPNDIETKVFSSSLRGYNKKEVDEFLDQIMIDYQALLDQNAKMLERVHVLQKQVAEAKDPARMTQDAKRMMNDISASAEQKAELIIRNAKHDAENIVRNAKDSTSQADEDAERLRRKVEKFKLRFRQMLEEEIDRVDDNSEDLLDDLREDFYPTLLYGEAGSDMTKAAAGAMPEEDPIASLPDVEPTDDIEDSAYSDKNPVGPDDETAEISSDDAEAAEAAPEETAEPAAEAPEAGEVPESSEPAAGAAKAPEFSGPAAEAAKAPEFSESAQEADGSPESGEPAAEADKAPENGKQAPEPASEAEESAEDADIKEAQANNDGAGEVLNKTPGGVPSATIVLDRAALERALAGRGEHARSEEQDGNEQDTFRRAPDETLIIERPEEIAEAAEKYGEYDDPFRTDPAEEEEPEPETEEEQAAKYADYADR